MVIGWLWMLLDNGFRCGTAGSNRFGSDPLASAAGGALNTGR